METAYSVRSNANGQWCRNIRAAGAYRPRIASIQPRYWTCAGGPPRRSPIAGEQVFVERGYVVMWDRQLAAPVATAERVLDWCSGPTPENAYEWALERAEYERRRKEVCYLLNLSLTIRL
jgi:hypothetical protein